MTAIQSKHVKIKAIQKKKNGFFGILKRIINYICRNPDIERFKGTGNSGWNIYWPYAEIPKLRARYRRLHRWWKYAIIAPIVLITKALFGKFLKEPIKDKDRKLNLTNIKIIDKSLEETYEIWYKEFYVNIGKDCRQIPTKKQIRKAMKKFYAIDIMRTMHRAVLKYGTMDTAYKPIFDIFPHVLAKNMIEHYKDKQPVHILYTSRKINDPMYMLAIESLAKPQGKINIPDGIFEEQKEKKSD